MISDTPEGRREEIEKTLQEYGLVVMGKMAAEEFLAEPLEVMALKQKLRTAEVELRNAKELHAFAQDNNRTLIESLETDVNRLHTIIHIALRAEG